VGQAANMLLLPRNHLRGISTDAIRQSCATWWHSQHRYWDTLLLFPLQKGAFVRFADANPGLCDRARGALAQKVKKACDRYPVVSRHHRV